MDVKAFEAAGLYDPEAPNAADHLALLAWIASQGIALADIVEAAQRDQLNSVVGDRAIRSGERSTEAEVLERVDLTPEQFDALRRSLGYHESAPDERIYTEADIEAFRNYGLARAFFSERAILELTRVFGASMARIADAANSIFIANVEADIRGRSGTELEVAQSVSAGVALLDSVPPTLEAIFRYHMAEAIVLSRRSRRGVELQTGTDLARVAVGFVDVSGYTTRTRQLASLELAELVDRFESTARDAVTAHGGRLVKLIGDEVMFIAVEPQEAVAIARDLLGAFDDDMATHGGIAYGEVLARGGDYYGPIVNLAARLAEAAVPHEMLVTESVAEVVDGLDPAGKRMLKGFDEPVTLFSLVSV